MRKIILLTGLAVFLFASCERQLEPEPYADFGVEYSLVVPGEVIFFDNFSDYADRFVWDFGDGTVSYNYAPNHHYQNEGTYRVRLAAYRGNLVDYAYLTIEVYETTLEVEVIEYPVDGAPVYYVPNVEITLYTSFPDWENFTNEVGFGVTDSYGTVVFKGVETISYFIDAYNASFNNEALAYHDVNFIQTAPLAYASHNIFTCYVDYDPAGQMQLKSTRMRVKPTTEGPTRAAKDLDLNRLKEK